MWFLVDYINLSHTTQRFFQGNWSIIPLHTNTPLSHPSALKTLCHSSSYHISSRNDRVRVLSIHTAVTCHASVQSLGLNVAFEMVLNESELNVSFEIEVKEWRRGLDWYWLTLVELNWLSVLTWFLEIKRVEKFCKKSVWKIIYDYLDTYWHSPLFKSSYTIFFNQPILPTFQNIDMMFLRRIWKLLCLKT